MYRRKSGKERIRKNVRITPKTIRITRLKEEFERIGKDGSIVKIFDERKIRSIIDRKILGTRKRHRK
jgi:hypothetical protein